MKFLKNDIDFKMISSEDYNAIGFAGHIRRIMPDLKFAVEQGYKIGNFRDRALGGMEKYNPSGKNDRDEFNKNDFALIGNPVISNPNQSGERIIINDLEQKVFAPLKKKILSMNRFTNALPLSSTKEEAVDIYYTFKREGAEYITVLTPTRIDSFLHTPYTTFREEIVEGLFLGNETEKEDYIEMVRAMNNISERNRVFEQLFLYNVRELVDASFLFATSVKKYDDKGTAMLMYNAKLDDLGNIFAVNPATFLKQPKEKIDSKIGKSFDLPV
jgi:hypothetical protein